jgi:hypothetical protein
VLAAQTTGVALLRLADAEVLPFDYEAYGTQILEYIGEIEQQATKASADGAKQVDFAGLRSAAEAFAKAGADVRARGESMLSASAPAPDLAAINKRLMMAERDLIEPAGLPDRPWYRHVIYAPGLYTGYGVKTIPGVREAWTQEPRPRCAGRTVIRALQLCRRRRFKGRDRPRRSIDKPPAPRCCGLRSGSSSSKGSEDPLVHRRVAARGAARAGRSRCRPGRGAMRISNASRCRTGDLARLVPLGEITSGVAMIAGVWTPLFACRS